MSDYVVTLMGLTPLQISKLLDSKAVTFSPRQTKQHFPLYLKEAHNKKILDRAGKGKRMRIKLDDEELAFNREQYEQAAREQGAEGIKEMLTAAKKVGEVVKKGTQAVSRAVGKEEFRKMLSEGLRRGVKAVLPAAAPVANAYADDLVNMIGDKTGAFGIRSKCGGSSTKKLSSSQSQLLCMEHPAMDPYAAKISAPGIGGSFRALI